MEKLKKKDTVCYTKTRCEEVKKKKRKIWFSGFGNKKICVLKLVCTATNVHDIALCILNQIAKIHTVSKC